MVRVVVLLGPPGSGKSTVGRELARLGFRWREWEDIILARWGSRDAFVAVKAEALPKLQRDIRRWIDADGALAAIETTGLSDADFLDRLEGDELCFVARLDVSREEAARRVTLRPQGRHLDDDEQVNQRVWHLYEETVRSRRHADLVIDTERTASVDAARLIADTVRRTDRP